eukprot:472790-Hanusia_phi.AAC.1
MMKSKAPDIEFATQHVTCSAKSRRRWVPEADVDDPDVRNQGRSKEAERPEILFSVVPFAHSRPRVEMNLARSCISWQGDISRAGQQQGTCNTWRVICFFLSNLLLLT